MNKYVYDNNLAHYTQKELNAYAKMVHKTIGNGIHIPGHFQTLDEDLQNKVMDINREMYLRSHSQ